MKQRRTIASILAAGNGSFDEDKHHRDENGRFAPGGGGGGGTKSDDGSAPKRMVAPDRRIGGSIRKGDTVEWRTSKGERVVGQVVAKRMGERVTVTLSTINGKPVNDTVPITVKESALTGRVGTTPKGGSRGDSGGGRDGGSGDGRVRQEASIGGLVRDRTDMGKLQEGDQLYDETGRVYMTVERVDQAQAKGYVVVQGTGKDGKPYRTSGHALTPVSLSNPYDPKLSNPDGTRRAPAEAPSGGSPRPRIPTVEEREDELDRNRAGAYRDPVGGVDMASPGRYSPEGKLLLQKEEGDSKAGGGMFPAGSGAAIFGKDAEEHAQLTRGVAKSQMARTAARAAHNPELAREMRDTEARIRSGNPDMSEDDVQAVMRGDKQLSLDQIMNSWSGDGGRRGRLRR